MTLQFETTPLLNRSNSMSSSLNTFGQPMKKYGKLVLVDLAGSERLKVQSQGRGCNSLAYVELQFISMGCYLSCDTICFTCLTCSPVAGYITYNHPALIMPDFFFCPAAMVLALLKCCCYICNPISLARCSFHYSCPWHSPSFS